MTLLRLTLRRHGPWVLGWVLALAAGAWATAPSYGSTYATEATQRAAGQRAQGEVASTLLYGPLDVSGRPALMFAWEMGAYLTIGAAVMGVLLAVRVTRADEAGGAREMLRATGVRPGAPGAVAAGLVAAATCLLTAGVAVACGVQPRGQGFTWTGAGVLGAVVAATFAVSAGTTMLAAQALPTPGLARGAGFAAVALAFAARAAGDLQGWRWLALASPMGLRSTARPFHDDDLVPVLLALGAAAATVAGAAALDARRELHGALVPARDRSGARLQVRTPWGLTVRLGLYRCVVWTLSLATTGAFLAAMGNGLIDGARRGDIDGGMLGTRITAADAVGGYFGYLGSVVGILAGVLAILAVQACVADERHGLTEAVRATGARRWVPLAAATGVSMTSTGFALVATAVASALAARAAVHDPGAAASAWHHMLGQWPAAVALAGLTALVVGVRPRWAPVAWVPLLAGAVAVLLGALLRLPRRVIAASVLGHATPDGAVSTAQLTLVVVGLVAAAVGLWATTRRDVTTG